eukprot:gnl/TRDRNA2_/TRDRNA2_132360_c1_seq1.p1 gnl/TRDRNA2_/TRDRNA2_132360_c1~~gnl/TRDRNA2_/TRDRNA2_132360_c1_seq1.p1  ORF type:complete len:269 (+),score=67.50 gnl/TRDRNA2_/TRDRNA2_132360_c1_seq1:88-894(+)
MRRRVVLTLFAAVALSALSVTAEDDVNDDEDESAGHAAANGEDDDNQGQAPAEERKETPSSVFVMEHSFLSDDAPRWLPRGTLLLSKTPGERGFEARLSEAQEFVQMRPEMPTLMQQSAEQSRYYALRMYSPESPKRVLQAAVPARLLADHFEDWHDVLEVSVAASGVPVSLSYRVRHALGLALFDHTQVHIAEPDKTEGPRVPPKQPGKGGAGGAAGDQQPQQSFLRRYWWVIIIAMLLLSSGGADPPQGGAGGKASGGGGGGGGKK